MDSIDARWVRGLERLRWHLFASQIEPARVSLRRHCRRLTRDASLAEDLEQETLLRGYSAVSDICQGVAHPRAFLIRVATNLWLDHEKRRREELVDRLPELVDDARDHGRRLDAMQALTELTAALPPKELRAFVLRDILGYSGAETATALGVSEAAIKMAAGRARRRLQRRVSTAPVAR